MSGKGISRVRSKKWCQEQLFAVVRFHLQIYYWGDSRLSERRGREIPGDVMSVNVSGGSKRSHTVTKLTPYTNYNFSITAYNNGGEGPASDEAYATTDEAGKLCYWVHSPRFFNRVLNETDCPPTKMNTLRKSLSFFCLFVDCIRRSLRARLTERVF